MSAGAVAQAGGEPPRARHSGWLRSPAFDLTLIAGVLGIALLAGGAALTGPALFAAVLAADLWLLAYPHVASTFTRVAFDRKSARQHRFLLLGVPFLVFGGTAGVALLGGAAALNTLYFYWQTYHYTKQSYGIARAYRRAGGAPAGGRDLTSDFVVFAFPVWGVLHRASQAHPTFYGATLYAPPVPRWLVMVAGAAAMTALAAWTVQRVRALSREGTASLGLTLYVASHVIITAVSYLVVAEITYGWLFINVWHNAQYLLFVWSANARRFSGGSDPERPFISWLSQPRRLPIYAAVCLGSSALFYLALGQTSRLPDTLLPFYLVCHQAVNFYHYVVDAVIWRAPRAAPLTRD